MSMSTPCQDRCPAVKKLVSLQQAPGRLHVETWTGRGGNPSLQISQEVEIMPGCADMVTRLPPPFFSSVSPGPGRKVRNGIGWSLMEKTARSEYGCSGCLGREQCIFLHLLHLQVGFGRDRSLQLTFFVFLLIFVWARDGCRAPI